MRFTPRAAVSVLVGAVVLGAAFFGGYVVGRDSVDEVVASGPSTGSSTTVPDSGASTTAGSTVPGETTVAPPVTTAAPDTPTTLKTTYVVKSGDTLGKIAKEFGTSIAALVELNQIKNPDRIVEGTTLQIPPPTVAPTVPPGAPTP